MWLDSREPVSSRQEIRTNWLVCDYVVDIVTGLPPTDGEAAAKISNEHANERVHDEDLSNGPVPSIVCGEHDLVLIEKD